MTRPDSGDDQSPDLSPDLWEPLSEDTFAQMLSAAMDPLATPEDLSDVPDQAEDYPEDFVFDGDAEDSDGFDDGAYVDADDVDGDFGEPDDDLDDLDDLFGDSDGSGNDLDAYGDADQDDSLDDGVDGGDAL